MSGMNPVTWTDHDSVLFDLDGVLTPTAEVHMRAWAEMFNAFLSSWHGPAADTSAYTARGIDLPEGDPSDAPDLDTVCGLGNRKNDAFNAVLERDGVSPYPGSVALLDHLRDLGMPLAVVSSSANAPAVLEAAGLAGRFVTVVDGRVATELGLPGKPAPDTFVHAATACGTTPARSVVVEDAVSGVRAGAAGEFGLVIGVDRGAGTQTLTDAGAHLVVADLAELVEPA